MSVNPLPPISALSSSPETIQVEVLDALFEPSPAIHDTLLPITRERVFASYGNLIDACHMQLVTLAGPSTSTPGEMLLSVLGSHPRLGAKKVDSAQSAAEQANLQGQGEELAKLNEKYETKFPGLRYVVFVNGRGRPEIMENMKVRIARGDYSLEVQEALQVRTDSRFAISHSHLRPCETLRRIVRRSSEPKTLYESLQVRQHHRRIWGGITELISSASGHILHIFTYRHFKILYKLSTLRAMLLALDRAHSVPNTDQVAAHLVAHDIPSSSSRYSS